MQKNYYIIRATGGRYNAEIVFLEVVSDKQ